MKKLIIICLTFLSLLSTNSVFAANGIHYLDGYTKVNKSTYNYNGSVDIEVSLNKPGYKTIAVDQSNNKVYTLDSTDKNIIEYTNGVVTKTINFIDNNSPSFTDVKMVYQPTTGNLYIFGITGNGTYNFPTNSNLTINNVNKALFIITYSTIENKVIDTFSIGGGNNNVVKSFNIDNFNNIYINTGIGDLTSSEGNITIIDKDGIINSSAVFSGTTMITSTQNIDGTNGVIAGKMDNGSSFIQKINLTTMIGNGNALEIDNADISDLYYNSVNNKIYALLSFTGTKQINGITYTNNTGTDSVVLVLDDAFTTVRSFQIAGDGEINVKRFIPVEDDEILLYGEYTNNLSNPIIGNRGGKDVIMLKLKNGTTETDFVGIATFTKMGNDIISDFATDGGTYYYAIINNSIYKLGNNIVNEDTGICGEGFIAVRDTVMVDILTGKYNYGTTNQRSINSSNPDKLDDYSVYNSILAGSDGSTYYNIVNLSYVVDGVKYSNGIATKGTSTIGNSKNGATFPNDFGILYKTELQENLYKAVMNGTPLAGNNGLSYYDFYKYKGIHPAMLFNKHPFYNVDYTDSINLTTTNSKYNTLNGKYIWGRNFKATRAVVDDINKTLTKQSNNVITYSKLDGGLSDPLFGDNYHYPLLPVKSVSDGKIGAYIQYSCGNVICGGKNCFGGILEKPQCGNGKLDGVELCDGNLFKDMDKVAIYKGLGYDISCDGSCNIKIVQKTNTTSQYPMQVLRCEPITPKPKKVYCGDGIIQTKEEKDAFVALDPANTYSDNISEVCDSELGCDPKSCTFAVYDERCGDGIMQSLFTKQTHFKANPLTYKSDFIEETCDGTDGLKPGETCSASCIKTTNGSVISELFGGYCGNGKVDAIGETCDGTDGLKPGETCSDTCKIAGTEKAYCGNNKVDVNETCDGDDRSPIGYNPNVGEVCTQCIKWVPPVTTPGVCGDGIIGKKEDGKNETCDLGSAIASEWSKAGCGYPTIDDPNSNTGGTLPNPNGCYKAVCGNGIIEDTEICDQGEDNGKGIFKDGFSCNETCSINIPENLTCGNGKIDVFTDILTGVSKVEQCDNKDKNDGITNVGGVVCNDKCEIVLPCNANSKTSSSINSKYNFFYITPITDKDKLEIWSYDPKTEIFLKKRAILPTSKEFAKFYGSKETSNYTDQELMLGRSKIEKGLEDIAKAGILKRNNGSSFSVNKRIQLLTNDSKGFASLSFSLSEINQRTGILRKFLFKQGLTMIEPYSFEVSTTSCSNDEPETQGTLNIIGIINGDTDSIYLVKNFGEYIVNNPYISTY